MKKTGGVSAPQFKSSFEYPPEAMPTPSKVTLPMAMHFGAPAKPVVSAGDEVKVGQLIAKADGDFSSPVYAGVSGIVKSIEDYDELTGRKAVSITIASDGKQTPCDNLAPVGVGSFDEFLKAVKDSGVVGLGGTEQIIELKKPGELDYILINGIDCEPYITCETTAIMYDPQSVWEGVLLLKDYLAPKNIVICVAYNQPEAIKKMQELSTGVAGVEVRALAPNYPQGLGKMLALSVTGRIVPEGGRLSDVGCMVVSCTAVSAFAKYIKTGRPLTTVCVSVGGSSVKSPKNVVAPIGAPVYDLLDFCDTFGFILDVDVGKVILGGPMRGMAIPNLNVPITKTTSAVLAFKKKDCEVPDPTPCIKCSRCIHACPINLMPPNFENALELKKHELLEKFKVNACIECGCCAYNCPARRPLVQVIALAKNMLSDYKAAQEREA